MAYKTLKQFVRENRKEIDEAIKRAYPSIGKLNDGERQEWIQNDEGLYNWAKSEGVKNP